MRSATSKMLLQYRARQGKVQAQLSNCKGRRKSLRAHHGNVMRAHAESGNWATVTETANILKLLAKGALHKMRMFYEV